MWEWFKDTCDIIMVYCFLKCIKMQTIPKHFVGISTIAFIHFPNKPWFLHVCSTSLLKTLWDREKLLIPGNFSFSLFPTMFTVLENFCNFIKFEIVVCKLFQFGRVSNWSFEKGLNSVLDAKFLDLSKFKTFVKEIMNMNICP